MNPQLRVFLIILVLALCSLGFYLYGIHASNGPVSDPKNPNSFNVLVTGGAGFIGSHLVEHFEAKEPDCFKIFVLDDLSTGDPDNLKGFKKVELIKGSIDDQSLVERILSKRIKYIFHLGAKISVGESFLKPKEYTQINTMGTLILLDAAKKYGVESFVLSSSSAIYGDGDGSGRARTEDEVPNPISPYGKTKLDGEFYVQQWSGQGRRGISLRYYNVFGERQQGSKPGAAAIPAMIYKAIHHAPITIHGDGEQTRDFIYVKDVVSANVYAAKKLIPGVYNVGYEHSITLNQLAKTIVEKCDSKSEIEHGPAKTGDIKKSIASTKKIRSQDWSPTFDLEEGLRLTVQWSKEKYGASSKK